jgi:hypothetical protein
MDTQHLRQWLQGTGTPQPPQQEPPQVMTFGEFMTGDYEHGAHNLYIVWRDRQALYIGIANCGIYNRWFTSPSCHMEARTKIAQVIERNRPASMGWVIELRHITGNLEKAERELIRTLRPLFNGTHRAPPTREEIQLTHTLEGTIF